MKKKPKNGHPKQKDPFDSVFAKMTEGERDELVCLSFSGMYIRSSNTVLMGSDAMDRYINFKQSMIDKYSGK
jgi:hypothetical protein